MNVLTATEMRSADQVTAHKFGVSMETLMENAGSAVAAFALSYFKNIRRCTVLCGTGNNGGDGFVAARHLASHGIATAVLVLGDPSKLQGEAGENYGKLDDTAVAVFSMHDESELPGLDALLSGTDLILDAVVGTGFKPPLRGMAAIVQARLQALATPVLSVDLPSGWDADSTAQQAENAFRSSAVVTFTAPKLAHVFGHLTAQLFDPVVVAPIGSPQSAIATTLGLTWAGASKTMTEKPRAIDTNKGRFGHVLVVGGSLGKSGAPSMSSLSALRTGAGLVTAAVPRSILNNVALIVPELMTSPLTEDASGVLSLGAVEQVLELLEKKVTVLAIGPGVSTQGEASEAVRRIVAQTKLPLVLDADALNAFASHTHMLNGKDRTIVLTPHPGEMARLIGTSVKEVESDRVNIARNFATTHHVTLLLKGWRTLIAHPNGSIAVNTSGNPSMAKGGSGDILTGIVAAMLAQYPDRVADAVNTAAYLHGLAGDFAAHDMDEHTILATDTVAHLSRAFQYRSTDSNSHTWLCGIHTA